MLICYSLRFVDSDINVDDLEKFLGSLCVLFTIARTKARTRSRISVWSLQRGVKAQRASPLICSLCHTNGCSFCIHGVSRLHTARSLTFVGVSINERHDSNVSEKFYMYFDMCKMMFVHFVCTLQYGYKFN